MHTGPACQSAQKADAVFVGKVYWSWWLPRIAGDGSTDRHVKIKILEHFVGDYSGWVTVETGIGGGDCGFDFSWGEKYLIYAFKGADGSLRTSICSRTTKFSDANADLEYLRGIGNLPLNGLVYGIVEQYTDRLFRARPLPGTAVHLKGSEKFALRNVVSGPTGEYKFPDVTPGSYAISADLPKFLTPFKDYKFTVPAKGCTELNITAEFNGRLAGRITNKRGIPIADLEVDAVRTADTGTLEDGFNQGITLQDGTFEIGPLLPGVYVVGVNIIELELDQKNPKTYYPGTRDLLRAKRIRVGEGQLVKNLNFQAEAGVQSLPVR
jgi:hypothetical protein